MPQGSTLDPLLFLIYANDMPVAVKCDLFLYADDTQAIILNQRAASRRTKKGHLEL